MLLTVKVFPGAPKTAFKRFANGILYISVAAAPQKGKANGELVRFLAEKLKVSANDIKIVSGGAGRLKRVKLPIPENILAERLCRT